MLLEGTVSLRDNKEIGKGTVQLQKTEIPVFNDEWDFVIENYTLGANDPTIIDSISTFAFTLPTPLRPKNRYYRFETSTSVVNKPVIRCKKIISRNSKQWKKNF